MTMPMRRLLMMALLLCGSSALARDFYFDSVNGLDTNNGTSTGTAWQTLIKLQSVTLTAGDRVFFRSGQTFDAGAEGNLGIRIGQNESGTANSPILFTAWGTGAKPTLRSSRSGSTNIFYLQGSYITIDGLHLTEASDSSIIIEDTSMHDVVKNCEFENLGIGLAIYGQHSLITRNYFHDLLMVRNTPTPTDDDYGANAVVISGSNTEVSYNLAERLIVPSYDYGVDGGFAELYGTMSNVFIHHNIVKNSDGFSETGGQTRGGIRDAISNVTYAYNLSVNNTGFLTLHNAATGNFDVDHSNFVMENNTIVELGTTSGRVVWMPQGAAPTPTMLTVRNNVIRSAMQGALFSKSGFTHLNNLYHLTGSATIGFTADPSEITSNAQLLNEAGGDYHLGMTSPAINAGLNLGYTSDLDGNAVPAGSAPDLGAYEYGSSPVSDAGSVFDAGQPVDAGRPDSGVDAGRPDAGFDAGRPDSGTGSDAGRPDAGLTFDAGRTDSGVPDAGRPDSGTTGDAGSVTPDAGQAFDAGQSDAGNAADAGVIADAGTEPDAGSAVPDSGAPMADAGPNLDSGVPGVDAGAQLLPDGGTDTTPPMGCSCSHTNATTLLPWGALLLLLISRRRLR